MEKNICLSCKKETVNDPGRVNFKCPSCNNYELTRCMSCRQNAVKYSCPSCGFTGPN